MTDECDALFGALPAAIVKRIGSHVDVCAVVILMREPAEVTRRKRLFELAHTLLGFRWALHAQQESNRRARSEAPSEKVFGNFVHRTTSVPFLIARALRRG